MEEKKYSFRPATTAPLVYLNKSSKYWAVNGSTGKNKKNQTKLSNEELFEDNIRLKQAVNELSKELIFCRTEILKKESEINKFSQESQQFNNTMRKSANFMEINLKKNNKDLIRRLKLKEAELEEMKKNSKIVKIKELENENGVLLEELNRMRKINDNLLKQCMLGEKIQKEYSTLRDNYNKQKMRLRGMKSCNCQNIIQENVKSMNESKQMKSNFEFNQFNQLNEEEMKTVTYFILTYSSLEEITNALDSPENFANELILILKLKDIKDKTQIFNYSQTLFTRGNANEIKDYLLRCEREINSRDIKQELGDKLNQISDAMKKIDKNETGLIHYNEVEKICEEYSIPARILIPYMKQDITKKGFSILNLDYTQLTKIEEKEIVMKMEDYEMRLESIFTQVSDYLHSHKKYPKEIFNDIISIQTDAERETYLGIILNDFVLALKNMKIELDTIDVFCIFNKLNYSEEAGFLDYNKLLLELAQFGIRDYDRKESEEYKNHHISNLDGKNDDDLDMILEMDIDGLD